MRFKVDKELVDDLDDEILVQYIGVPIGDLARAPKSKTWTAYSANPHLHRALVSIAVISDAVLEVLNGGVFQLIGNPTGGLLPDLPAAYRHLGREREAKIIEEIIALFPDEATIRDYEKRNAFASTKIIPGGMEGLSKAKGSAMYKKLEAWENELADFMQSEEFFAAVADFIRKESDAFEIVE